MGALVDGVWNTEEVWRRERGRFFREASQFRSWLNQADGRFAFEPGRYHLYVSYACPWAHRTLIVRALKGLESAIGVSGVEALMLDNGWEFSAANPDHVNQRAYAYELYQLANSAYSGRVTVPILWDSKKSTIVSNESSEIIRMFNQLEGVNQSCPDIYPKSLRGEIDRVNDRVYRTVNNGVYRAGFSTTEGAYAEAVGELFATLDWLEQRLEGVDYLVGDGLTEADIRLFPTLVRFDSVYYGHFKCAVRRIMDYPNLWGYLRGLYHREAFGSTTRLEEIKRHYYGSHRNINPTGIVPIGPILSWDLDRNATDADGRVSG
jgi:putative glutathione S-transferase